MKLMMLFVSDIDECNEGSHGCKQLCINSVGSYVCKCPLGYRLNADARSCDGKPVDLLAFVRKSLFTKFYRVTLVMLLL